MTGWLEVKNWDRFQHYKDRHPPWIKLHYSVLDDFAWSELPDASKAHLMGIWLLASRNDGRIPNEPTFVARRIGAKSKVDLALLMRVGFLVQLDSTAPADCTQNAPLEEKRREEAETEAEKIIDEGFQVAWKAYPRRPNDPKAKAAKAYTARIREGADPAAILDGVKRYAAYCRRERTEPKYIKQAATFFGPDRHWESDYTSAAPKPSQPGVAYQKYQPPLQEGPAFVPVPAGEIDPRLNGLVGSIGRPLPKVSA